MALSDIFKKIELNPSKWKNQETAHSAINKEIGSFEVEGFKKRLIDEIQKNGNFGYDDLYTTYSSASQIDENYPMTTTDRIQQEHMSASQDENLQSTLLDIFRRNVGTPQETAQIFSASPGSQEYVDMQVSGDGNKYSDMPVPTKKRSGSHYYPPVRPELANMLNALQEINYEGDPDSFINQLIESGVLKNYGK